MHKTLLKTILFIACLACQFAFAQDEILRAPNDNILWGRYWLKIDLTERIRINEMLINQTFINGGFRERQILNHLFARYTGNHNEFYGLGISTSGRWQDENIQDRFLVPEHRIFQEFGIGGNLFANIKFNSSTRLEQRFFHNASEKELMSGYYFRGRIRYTQLFSRALGKKFTGRVGAAIFINIWDKGEKPSFNSSRTSLGLDYHISDKVSVNAEYQLQMRKPVGFERASFGNVIRLSFIHTMKRNKDAI